MPSPMSFVYLRCFGLSDEGMRTVRLVADIQDPYAAVVLLHNDLVLIDLTTPG